MKNRPFSSKMPLLGAAALTILGCGSGSDDALVEERAGSADEAIIYGTEYPEWAVRNYAIPLVIVLDASGQRPPYGSCTSTLLDDRWVITAAHCFPQLADENYDGKLDDPARVSVRFGNIDDPLAVEVPAELVVRHPSAKWGVEDVDHVDVALIRLASSAPAMNIPSNHFTNGRMAIYAGKNATLVGKGVTLAGYGKSIPRRGDPPTGIGEFRTSFLTVTSSTDRVIAFIKSTPDGLSNHGDSGGPTLYDLRSSDGSLAARFLTGVASLGNGVDFSNYIGAQAYREWVSKTAWGKIKPSAILAHSGFSNPTNLIDGDVDSASVDNDTTASVELDLGGTFRVSEVRLAEDNYQQWKVYSYSVQCWNGSSWGTVQFNDTSTDVAKPRFDEHALPTPCSTNRIKVNFSNPEGPVEVFEFEVYGTQTGNRTLTVGATPSFCSTSPAPGNYSLPVGSDFNVCADSCAGQVFEHWNVSGDVWIENAKAACTRVRNLQNSGTVSAKYHPEFVNVTVAPAENAQVQTGSYRLAYNTLLEFQVTPNDGYRVERCSYPDASSEDCSYMPDTGVMSLHVYADGVITPLVRREQIGITSIVNDLNGTISPGGGNSYDKGSDATFTFTPNAGYRVKEVCPSRFPSCLPWAQNAYTLTNVGAPGIDDSQFAVGFEYANYKSRANTAMCLDAANGGTANGTQIQLWDCHAGGHPAQWYYLRQLQAGQYEIRNGGSNRCVDVNGGSTSTTAKVQLYTCNSGNAQRFQLTDTGDQFARLQRVGTNLCLEAIGTGRNALIQQRSCGSALTQQWRIPR